MYSMQLSVSNCPVKLLKSKHYAIDLATNARSQIEKHHSWEAINTALDEILDEVLAGER